MLWRSHVVDAGRDKQTPTSNTAERSWTGIVCLKAVAAIDMAAFLKGNTDTEGLCMQQKLVVVSLKLGNKANKAPSEAVRMILTHKARQK